MSDIVVSCVQSDYLIDIAEAEYCKNCMSGLCASQPSVKCENYTVTKCPFLPKRFHNNTECLSNVCSHISVDCYELQVCTPL